MSITKTKPCRLCRLSRSQLDEASLGLRRQIITLGPNNSIVQVYHQLMVDTAMLLGADNKTRVKEEMWDVIALEAQIAQVWNTSA